MESDVFAWGRETPPFVVNEAKFVAPIIRVIGVPLGGCAKTLHSGGETVGNCFVCLSRDDVVYLKSSGFALSSALAVSVRQLGVATRMMDLHLDLACPLF